MQTVKNNHRIVICGQGRIGGAFADELSRQDIGFDTARLDSKLGLVDLSAGLNATIDLLVICISARQKSHQTPRWQWQDILLGLHQQLITAQCRVNQLVMISSTRVYEGITNGIVEASSKAVAKSTQGEALITAEHLLLSSPSPTIILRCSGLYGDLYPIYTPILKAGKDKVRTGVDARQVVERLMDIVRCILAGNFVQQIELLTDGYVYFEGKQYSLSSDMLVIKQLAKSQKVLIASVHSEE